MTDTSLSTMVILKTEEFHEQINQAKKAAQVQSTLYYTKAIFTFGLCIILPDIISLVFVWHVCCSFQIMNHATSQVFKSIAFILFKGPIGKIPIVNGMTILLLLQVVEQNMYIAMMVTWIYILYNMLVVPRIYDVLNLCMYPMVIGFVCLTAILANWVCSKNLFFAHFAIVSLSQKIFGKCDTPYIPIFVAYMYVIGVLINVIGFFIYL